MSALPAEVPPSGAVPADIPQETAATPGAAVPDRVVPRRGLRSIRCSPARGGCCPDGDCIFPGGGDASQARPRLAPAARPAPAATPSGGLTPSGRARAGIRVRTGASRKAAVAGGHRPGRHRPAPASRRLTPRPARLSGPATSRRRSGQPPGRVGQPLRRVAGAVRAGACRSGDPAAGRVAGTVAPRRLRLTRRGRIVVAILAALAVCGLFVAGASAAQASGPASAHGRCRPAGDRPARRHAVVDRPERRPERRRPGHRAADPAGQPSHEPRHHGRRSGCGCRAASRQGRRDTAAAVTRRPGCESSSVAGGFRTHWLDTCDERPRWSTVTTTSSSYTDVFHPVLVAPRRGREADRPARRVVACTVPSAGTQTAG